MADEIRIEMMRRKADGTIGKSIARKSPFFIYPVGDGTMEIVNAYDYFLQAFCEVRPYARTELSRLYEACKDFFEKHGCHEFSKNSLGVACRRHEIRKVSGGGGFYAYVSLFGELSPIEKAINFIHSRDGDVWFDEISPSSSHLSRISSAPPWQTRRVWNGERLRSLIIRETVPPPIVPDGPR